MPKRTKPYHAWLVKRLADPREAERYLQVAMGDSPEVFLKSLRNVAEARQMTNELITSLDIPFSTQRGVKRHDPSYRS